MTSPLILALACGSFCLAVRACFRRVNFVEASFLSQKKYCSPCCSISRQLASVVWLWNYTLSVYAFVAVVGLLYAAYLTLSGQASTRTGELLPVFDWLSGLGVVMWMLLNTLRPLLLYWRLIRAERTEDSVDDKRLLGNIVFDVALMLGFDFVLHSAGLICAAFALVVSF